MYELLLRSRWVQAAGERERVVEIFQCQYYECHISSSVCPFRYLAQCSLASATAQHVCQEHLSPMPESHESIQPQGPAQVDSK